jgi:hypothetical protein
MEGTPQGRLEQIRSDIATRLRPINSDMPKDEFDEMVAQMALLQFRFETDRRVDPHGHR